MPRARFSTGWGIRRDRKAQRGSGAGGGGGGNPASILGPLLHADFDVADPGVVLNAGGVASIPNRGNDTAALVQATAANQPVYGAASFAGGPGMTLDGVNDNMLCAFASPIPTGRRPYIWTVFKATNTNPTNQIISSLEDSVASRYMVAWCNRSGTSTFFAAISTVGGGGLGNTDTNNHLMEVSAPPSGAATFVLDGVATDQGPGPAFDAPMTSLRVGCYNLTQFGAPTIRRLIVANGQPSQAQIDAMRAYIRAQPYGLTF